MRRLIVVVLLAALVSSTATAVPADDGESDDLGVSSVAAVVPAEGGGWLVLERSLDSNSGVVYQYDENWVRTGEQYRLNVEQRYGFSPTDIAERSEGGWWVLGEGGTVYRFSENWTYTGESYTLPHPHLDRNASHGHDLMRTSSGEWWITIDQYLYRYSSDWTLPADDAEDVQGTIVSHPVATAYDTNTSLVAIETGGTVTQYPLTDGGNRLAISETDQQREESSYCPAIPDTGYDLHNVVDAPVDIVRTDGGWWVVDADGQIHRFDEYWRYTGTTRSVGSGNAYASYPPDVVTLTLPVDGISLIIPGLLAVTAILWQISRGFDQEILFAGGGTVVFVYGVTMKPYTLRPAVFAEPHLPLVVISAAILIPLVHVKRISATDTGIGPSVLAYIPAVVNAVTMLSVALRPF